MPKAIAAYEIAVRQQKIRSIERYGIVGDDVPGHDEVAALRREIHQFEHIQNRKIVFEDDVLITGYRLSPRGQRRCIRRLRGKASRLQKGR